MATFESIQTGNIHIDGGERQMKDLSPLAQDRLQYQPRFPEALQNPKKISVWILFLDFIKELYTITTNTINAAITTPIPIYIPILNLLFGTMLAFLCYLVKQTKVFI